MVQTAQQYGVSYAARAFNTTRKSIRKWLKRYREERAVKSLENDTKAPINPHCPLPEEIRKLIVKLRLINKRRRTWKRKKLSWQWKEKLRPFEHIQIDVKQLCHVSNYLKQHCKNSMALHKT